MTARAAFKQADVTRAKPYSPETLAERWGCSSEKIRQMCHAGELGAFRLGRLIRIPANEVERVECLNTDLSNTETSGASLTPNRAEVAFESRLERLTGDSPKPAQAPSGGRAQDQNQNG